MLLGSTSAVDAAEAAVTRAGSERNFANRLLACVTATFPALPVGRSRVESTGGDHDLLIIDDRYAFRFPRSGMHDLKLEIEVLKHLQRRSSMPTPSYVYVDPAGRFAGYPFIEGVELMPSVFAALPNGVGDRVLVEMALFLSELHSIPVEAMRWPGNWPKAWTAAEFVDRGLAERLPLIARHVPRLAAPIETFYDQYRHDRPDYLVIVHGDLVPDHILLNRETDRLAGIIDFGDVALGDPAQDFLGFWSYGEEVASRLVELYRLGHGDPGLLRRARNHFIRYRIDQLFEKLRHGASDDAFAEVVELEALLIPPARKQTMRRTM